MTMARDEHFLSRWSRRKSESKESARENAAPADREPATGTATTPVPPPVAPERPPLPPVQSLTTESDFAPFMDAGVDGDVRRQALKTLFSDPRFNTMDMLDVYVDDYSKPDPLPESWLGKLEQLSRLGDRAGRDREEEERRRLADAAGSGGSAEVPVEPPSQPTADASQYPQATQGNELPGESAIPSLPSRDSGT